MKTQSALNLFQYWNRLRAGRRAPQRTDIQPSDIRDVLSQTFILQSQLSNVQMVFRIAGTSISNLFGRTLRGEAFRNLFQNQSVPVVSRLIRNCYQDHNVVVLELNAISKSGRQAMLEVILLPLQDEADGHRILGCIVPHEHQFWHGLEAIISTELQSIRLVDPEREPLFLANRPEVELLPTLAPTEDQMRFGAGIPPQKDVQLLVIQGGKSHKRIAEITKR